MTTTPAYRSGLVGPAAVVAAFAVFAAAVLLPTAAPNLPSGMVFEPIDRWALSVLALALLVLGLSVRRGAGWFGVLGFVFLTGGAAQIYMTEPLWFPALHLKPQNGREWVMVGVMAIEAAVALTALSRIGVGRLMTEAGGRLGWGRIALFLCLSFAFCSPVLNYAWRGAAVAWFAHVVVGAVLIALHLSVLVAMSQVRSPISGLHRLSPIVPATFMVLASLALGQFAFEHLPHVEDEVAYLFQARTFASGALSVPAPPDAALPGLEYYLLDVKDGRWFSTSVPGWPLALAPFVMMGLPWLINPILAGISVLLAYDIALRKVGRDQADLVALMMASSPWLIAAAASLMPHTLTLTLMLFAWWMVLRARAASGREVRRLVLAGLAMGWIFATRPLDGLVIGGLTGLWVLAGPGGSARRAALYVAGCAATGSLLLLHNYQMTGSPLRLALSDYLDLHWGMGANAYGFGPEIGPPGGWRMLDLWVGHGPVEAVLNTINLIASLQFDLLGWSVGSLALVFAFFLWQGRKLAFDWVMVLVIGAVVVTMAFYWFADSYYFGPRYWFLASFPLLYLSARGYDALRARFPGADGMNFIRIDSILGLCCVFGLFVFTPWRGVVKFYEYGNFHRTYRETAATGQFGNAIVIMKKSGDEGSAFILNDPWLSGPGPIFLHDTGTLDEDALRAAFPGREIIHYDANWTRHTPMN
ncbi:glycosyltransferase family 39 protein [Defluviimonas sp. SAOS-178_SWC]|uniref:glycosyltransferase family 39 protein n=1 Tax=Defluviimonas sp. SAOS-178_SWC TaxID=3121287 RepID=UPI003221E812